MNIGKGVYFYCCPYEKPDKAAYQHACVGLAEGLRELGVPVFSDTPYWRESLEPGACLFNPSPGVHPADCAAVVLNDRWFSYGREFPRELRPRKGGYALVYLDLEDGIVTRSWDRAFRAFDLILKSHFSRGVRYPPNCRPWAFGLTNRILAETGRPPPFEKRKREIVCNFRHGHYLRRIANRQFLPMLQDILAVDSAVDDFSDRPADPFQLLQWSQTGRRHYPQYYRRLRESAACSCFGGCFVAPFPRDPSSGVARLVNRFIQDRGLRTRTVVQYDSFRLWEALAAGAVVFHVDFGRYGVQLPVMPENWKHYIGIDLDRPDRAVTRLRQSVELLAAVSESGRAWAAAHYSPRATAERFLGWLEQKA